MKYYTEPDVTVVFLDSNDILTSSGGENDLWGNDIFEPIG